jgi:regulator of protease activity HflC (stomatin/prohibitin superfamily)
LHGIFVAIVLAIIGMRSVIVVPADSAYVVERLGRYRATLGAGVHVLTPFIDRLAFRFSLRPKDERLTDRCITIDNVPVSITSSIRWEIVEPRDAAYNSADPKQFVTELVRTRQRQWIGEHTWKDVRETTRELRSAVLHAAVEPAAQAGVKITEVEIEQIARHE